MTKTLSVSAIENGTVIDHIKPGQAIRIVHMLDLINSGYKATIGLNLTSFRMGLKDLLKIENYFISQETASQIRIFAPDATINVINEFVVGQKIITTLPSAVYDLFICPNLACITNAEPIKTVFNISENGSKINMTCQFCEKVFDRNQVMMV